MEPDIFIDPLKLAPFRAGMECVDGCRKWIAQEPSYARLKIAVQHLSAWQINASEVGLAAALCNVEEGSPLWCALIRSHNAAMEVVRRLHGQYFFWIMGGKGTWEPTWDQTQN